MKQYMPLKPVKRGSSSGWWLTAQTVVLDVQVYIGQEGGATEHGLGERVVLGLTEKYRRSNHHVFCDNFFSHHPGSSELHEHGLCACGTVRQTRRDFSADLRNVTVARGEGVLRHCNGLTAFVWQYKRPVHVLFTRSLPGETAQVSRNGSRVEVNCPSAIFTYT